MSIKKVILMLSLALIACRLFSAELPKPNYDNSIPFSMTYSLLSDPTEIQYIKDQFGGGLYAPLSFSIFNGVSMSWTLNPANANSGITQFKNTVDQLVAKAKFYGVGFHIVVYYGMSRGHNYYTDAKNEDIRNAQWYNDNNLATQAQMKTSSTSAAAGEYGGDGYDFLFDGKSEYLLDEMLSTDSGDSPSTNQYVFSTPSRYARKLRKHLEAKVKAAMDYLKLKQDQNPNMLIIASGPGEAELNSLRIQSGSPLPDYFCDYSPFTILEFRDWIRHTGMYAPSGEYSGQGYAGGGNRYLGSQGLTNFNADFNTSFSSWGLKYYHWNLSDPVDIDYSDSVNPDSRIIPVSSYKFDGMMPTSGQFYINGGFDPPRVMKKKGQNTYWDLWQTFRETMIHHYVKDVVSIVKDSGFDKDRYFTHQIPGDYLFGTRPNDPAIPNLNKRYYTSASPLWTADAGSVLDVGMGITSYDINFGTWYARTSEYVFSAIAAMSNNWGVLEYNPEITATGVTINTVQAIYERMIKLYNEGPHFIGFYKWESNADRIYKGTNREYAAKKFFDVIKDKARQDISRVFIPKALLELKGTASSVTHSIDLSWSQKIWSDLSFQWPHWGDFKEFVIYRGYSANFKTDASTEVVRTANYSYTDTDYSDNGTVYYKVAAVNVKGQTGSLTTIGVQGIGTAEPVLSVSGDQLTFGATTGGTTTGGTTTGGAVTTSQTISISNSGTGVLNWSVSGNAGWIGFNPGSGADSGIITVAADSSGKTPGTYTGTITIAAPGAKDSPQTISVTLRVYNSGQDEAPFGIFETPAQGSNQRSSIPVTGWVLDDIQIESVKLYRNTGGQSFYIGEAMLVEGARPDVIQAYPGYPLNTKAGWGYMLLTNFLPNGGNGTYTLEARAKDVTGHTVSLGTKTFTCDNANAVKPFGAIDTPAQGGVVSGSSYVNFGWALTPQPNSIPIDGSTISVYVDSVKVGKPVYNKYREDIATSFPGYANSNGAVGYFYLDTTGYTEGVHTISWIVRDSAGNEDGIGSRYFTVRNSTGTDTADSSANRMARVSNLLTDQARGPVTIKRGYGGLTPHRMVYPGRNGVMNIKIKPLERLEIHFYDKTFNISTLPIGSTLDVDRGIFYWRPPLAFAGEHRLTFACRREDGKLLKKSILITIQPQ